MGKSVFVREVWYNNIDGEFDLIKIVLRNGYSLASFDTEYPGTLYSPYPLEAYSTLSPQEYYNVLKKNVDNLQIIQLGLTLFNGKGELPDFGTDSGHVWQFNFADFDRKLHPYNIDSVSLFQQQGINLWENKKYGVRSKVFAINFISVLPFIKGWVTFQGSYDFGLLVKLLSGKKLPNNVVQFMKLVDINFTGDAYDVKLIARYLGYYGGLDKIGKILELNRVAGKSHQAGSDSLLTMQVFMKLSFKGNLSRGRISGFNHKLYGLVDTKNQTPVYCC